MIQLQDYQSKQVFCIDSSMGLEPHEDEEEESAHENGLCFNLEDENFLGFESQKLIIKIRRLNETNKQNVWT